MKFVVPNGNVGLLFNNHNFQTVLNTGNYRFQSKVMATI
jgi:hypothetical protein